MGLSPQFLCKLFYKQERSYYASNMNYNLILTIEKMLDIDQIIVYENRKLFDIDLRFESENTEDYLFFHMQCPLKLALLFTWWLTGLMIASVYLMGRLLILTMKLSRFLRVMSRICINHYLSLSVSSLFTLESQYYCSWLCIWNDDW